MRSSARSDESDKRAFFGRRKGHRLKPQQAALFDTLLPRLALDLDAPAPALAGLFDTAVREVRLHETTADASNANALTADEIASGGFFSNAVELLDQLLGTRHDDDVAADYSELVRREATLVSVHVDAAETAERVHALLESAGALRISTLPQRGLER